MSFSRFIKFYSSSIPGYKMDFCDMYKLPNKRLLFAFHSFHGLVRVYSQKHWPYTCLSWFVLWFIIITMYDMQYSFTGVRASYT